MSRHVRDSAFLLFGLCGAILLLWLRNRAHDAEHQIFTDKQVVTGKYVHHPLHSIKMNKPDKVWPGLLLVPVYHIEQVLLLNRAGSLLHFWPVDTDRARLLPGCKILSLHGTKLGARRSPWKELQHVAREYGLNWKVLWQYASNDILHHDIQRLESGETLLLERRKGRNRGLKFDGKPPMLRADVINIINLAGQSQWLWSTFQAFDHSYCGVRPCELSEIDRDPTIGLRRRVDWTHGNTARTIPENKWYPRYRQFKPGNILYYPRNFWEMYILDRETKEVAWQFPSERQREKGELRIYGGHEPHMIDADLPGAGNILLFDNGHLLRRPYSRILEIDPVREKVVWSYEDQKRFFSRVSGSVQRLPNGNTLISQDVQGRVFEVTQEKEIVWEVKFPHRIARAHKYPLEYCNF